MGQFGGFLLLLAIKQAWLAMLMSVGLFFLFVPTTSTITKIQKVFWLLAIPLFLYFGHRSFNMQFIPQLTNIDFFQLILFFSFYKMISLGIEVFVRKNRVSLDQALEYFFHPVYWLAPLHAGMITYSKIQTTKPGCPRSGIKYLIIGFCLCLVFIPYLNWIRKFLDSSFTQGFAISGANFVLLGSALFFAAFLEKSRVSFLTAGMFQFMGKGIKPDFNQPWLAKNLLDFWQRYHYWVLEFYIEAIYQPLSLIFARKIKPKYAVLISIFFTFFIGTTISHWLAYASDFPVTIVLAAIFGLATVIHYTVYRSWKNWSPPSKTTQQIKFYCGYLGVPITWLTVFFLFLIAYPFFGLGWSSKEFSYFVTKLWY